VLIVIGLALAVVLAPAPDPARAATTGAGYPGITPFGGYLGNYIAPDGTRVYCIDASLDWPSGSTSGGTVVTELTTSWGTPLDETTLRKLNYALLVWGQTADPATAAAVSAYLYAYTSGYARTHGAGYAAGAYYIDGEPAVLAAYDIIWSGAENQYRGPAPAVAVDVELTGREGVVSVSVAPSDVPATLTLTGATITGGTTGTGQSIDQSRTEPSSPDLASSDTAAPASTTAEVTDGTTVRVLADATEGEISVTADLAVHLEGGAAPSVVLYETRGQQRTVRGSIPDRADARASDSATAVLTAPPQLAVTGLAGQPEPAIGATAVTVGGVVLAAGTALARARRSRRSHRDVRAR
jgi:hypothetical protein